MTRSAFRSRKFQPSRPGEDDARTSHLFVDDRIPFARRDKVANRNGVASPAVGGECFCSPPLPVSNTATRSTSSHQPGPALLCRCFDGPNPNNKCVIDSLSSCRPDASWAASLNPAQTGWICGSAFVVFTPSSSSFARRRCRITVLGIPTFPACGSPFGCQWVSLADNVVFASNRRVACCLPCFAASSLMDWRRLHCLLPLAEQIETSSVFECSKTSAGPDRAHGRPAVRPPSRDVAEPWSGSRKHHRGPARRPVVVLRIRRRDGAEYFS